MPWALGQQPCQFDARLFVQFPEFSAPHQPDLRIGVVHPAVFAHIGTVEQVSPVQRQRRLVGLDSLGGRETLCQVQQFGELVDVARDDRCVQHDNFLTVIGVAWQWVSWQIWNESTKIEPQLGALLPQVSGRIIRDLLPEHVRNGFATDPGHGVDGKQQEQLGVADLEQAVAMPHIACSEATHANRRCAQLAQACRSPGR